MFFFLVFICIVHEVFLIKWLVSNKVNMINNIVNPPLLVQSHKQFEEVFKRTFLGEYFERVDKKMQKEFFQRYLQDFVALTMKVSTVSEQQVS